MKQSVYSLAITVLFCCPATAWPQSPELVLPIIQNSSISNLEFSPNGRLTASSSLLDTRIWETTSGRLIRTFPTPDDVITALSPDGKLLLSGTRIAFWDEGDAYSANIQLWDTYTGKLREPIYQFGPETSTTNLEFNKNGQYFLASTKDSTLIWNVSTLTLQHRFLGEGFWMPDGEQVLICGDQFKIANIKSGEIQQVGPDTISTNPNERIRDRVVLADEMVELYMGGKIKRWHLIPNGTLTEITPDLEGFSQANFYRSSLSKDGKRVASCLDAPAAQEAAQANLYYFIIWDAKTGKRIIQDSPIGANDGKVELPLQPLGFWGKFTPDFRTFIIKPGTDVGEIWAGLLAADVQTGKITEFGVKSLELTVNKNRRVYRDSIGVYNGGEFLMIKLEGEEEVSSTTLFFPGTGRLISFTGPLPTSITAIRDERWDLSLEDGLLYTIKEKSSGIVKARLLFADNNQDALEYEAAVKKTINSSWAVSSPSGLFDASADMMHKLHYVVGLETIGLDQLKVIYHEPGLLSRLLGWLPGKVRDVSGLTLDALFPMMEASIVENRYLDVILTPRAGGLGTLRFAVNGKTQLEDANPERVSKLRIDLKPYEHLCQPGPNTVSLIAANEEGWLESSAYKLEYTPLAFSRGTSGNNTSRHVTLRGKPKLYVLSIGTSKYAAGVKTLVYPDDDAVAMAKALDMLGRGLFGDSVEIKLLSTAGKTDQEISSKENIRAAFEAYMEQTKPADILVVFFAGHGLAYGDGVDNQFYYLTKDVADPTLNYSIYRKKYAISTAELSQWLSKIPAQKQVLILDACNAGKVKDGFGERAYSPVQKKAFDRMKDRTGIYILAGSGSSQESYEHNKFGQGLLTYSLLQGMDGAALSTTNTLDVMTLFQHARNEVPNLAKQINREQFPEMDFPDGGDGFEIGLKKQGMNIPYAPIKPMFIRNSFQDSEAIKDVLNLEAAIIDIFELMTLKGAKAEYVYLDMAQHESAYSIAGRYSIASDGQVIADCRLYKGQALMGKFKVSGKKAEVPGLAQAILGKVSTMLNR